MIVDATKYDNPREVPRYTIAEAALYLHIKPSTLRAWCLGRTYKTRGGTARSHPVIEVGPTASGERGLSFYNLAEAHVLSSMRFIENVKLPRIRRAIEWLRQAYPVAHPLIDHQFFTDGADVFVKKLLGRDLATINASAQGQQAIREIMNPILNRIEYDRASVSKIFPSIPTVDSPRVISITHNVAAGRPVVDKKGVRAYAIWHRFQAGETFEALAYDYEIEQEEVQAAVHYVDYIADNAA